MDIIRRIKPLKASYNNLSPQSKFIILIILFSLISISLPEQNVSAQTSQALFFQSNNYQAYLASATQNAINRYQQEQQLIEMERKKKLTSLVEQYLRAADSPLADHVSTLLTVSNWKKIVALANAESSLCRKYPINSANCWGVGGTDLVKLGKNLDEAIVAMNQVLMVYPKGSRKKYSQMDFEQMNGIYKKPAAEHWVINAKVVYQDLTALEKSL